MFKKIVTRLLSTLSDFFHLLKEHILIYHIASLKSWLFTGTLQYNKKQFCPLVKEAIIKSEDFPYVGCHPRSMDGSVRMFTES